MTYPSFSVGETLRSADMNAVGMWRTGGFTFTGQTTAQINNCFSGDFDKYKITYNIRAATGSAVLYWRLSVGGTPNATVGSYINSGRYVGFPGVGAADFSGAGTELGWSFYGTFSNNGECVVTDPFAARPTAFSGNFISTNASAFQGGYHNQSVAYDGLYLFNSTGSAMFGSINIYGLKN